MIEGNLEVNLPTIIWIDDDEKQSRAEAERRERVEEKESKCTKHTRCGHYVIVLAISFKTMDPSHVSSLQPRELHSSVITKEN